MPETTKDYIESEPLDRISLAIWLRKAGLDMGDPHQPIDFEDWDGLDDDRVRELVSHLGNKSVSCIYDDYVLDTAQQTNVLRGLNSGDGGMFDRAYDMGVFDLLTEVGNEV